MFFRMVKGTLSHQWKKMLMIAMTIALGTSLATAMLSVVFDVGDKVNQELKTYGANITVVPKEASVLNDLYDVEGSGGSGAYLREDELGKIKTIFWAFNIVDYAPFLNVKAQVGGEDVTVVGSWFTHHMDLPTGEQLDAGMNSLRSWWEIKDGRWIDESRGEEDKNAAMVGSVLAEKLGVASGDEIKVVGTKETRTFRVTGIFEAGGEEDNEIFAPLDAVQALGSLENCVDSIEVSALTTPDNELAVRAAKNPKSLTIAQYETWYCTAYVSSICYQIQEVITDSVASAVRQVAESEGAILNKTELLMLLITLLALVGSALGICNLVTASVMERSQELGLMKAIGAQGGSISGLVLTEIFITAIAGGALGFVFGIGFSQIIGRSVFGSAISIQPIVIPIVAVLVTLVTLAGSLPAIRMLLRLEPAEVLHGR